MAWLQEIKGNYHISFRFGGQKFKRSLKTKKGPRLSETEGATLAITAVDVQRVFAAINVGTETSPNIIGLRDNAILGVLAYTGARSGAVAKLRLRDFYSDGSRCLLRLREKNGKVRHIPVRHDLQESIDAYLNASGIRNADSDTPLFRASNGKTGLLSDRPLRCETVLRMFKRRVRDAGLSASNLTGHSYRAPEACQLRPKLRPRFLSFYPVDCRCCSAS